MTNVSEIQSAELSRRSALRKLALTAGGAAIFATNMTENRAAADQTKMAQKAVAYQDSPQGMQSCGNCMQFEPPASCKVVDGNISPGGWCKIYVKKPA